MPIFVREDKQTGTEISIHYEVIGNGDEVIVMHHGNGNCIDDWHTLGFVEALQDNFKLVLIDSRGYGKSSRPHDPREYSLRSRVDDTIAVMDRESIRQAHCFGASVGAATCLLLAKYYPHRFKSYIFATPYFTLFGEAIKSALANGAESYVAKLEQLIGGRIENEAIRKTFLSNNAAAVLAANSSEWFDYHDYIQYVHSPLLIYVGEKESTVNELKCLSENIAQSSGHVCDFHVISDAAHAEVYWSSKRASPLISAFIKKITHHARQANEKINLIQYADFEIDKYIDGVIEQFSVALAKTGVKNAVVIAEKKVIGEFFPGRKPNDKQFVFHIQDVDTGTQVGWIWLADRGNAELRVADLHINEVNRGLGYGAASMIVAEQFAIDKGFSTISLNVFDENVVAKKMYEGLEYKVIEDGNGRSEMHKALNICS